MASSSNLLALMIVTIWGINFTFIKWGLESFEPIFMTFLRFLLTALPLVLFIKRPQFNRIFITYALGTFVIQYSFIFTAMRLGSSAGLTALILQLQVFITLILARIRFNESFKHRQVIGLIIALAGLFIIGIHTGGDMPLLGLICIITAAVGWSFGNIAAKQLSDIPAISMVAWGGLIATIPLGIASAILEPHSWQWATISQAGLKSWLSLGFIVYISTLIGFGLWSYLLQHNPANKVMPFALLIPVIGMIASILLTGETLTWWKIAAMILIISGLIVQKQPTTHPLKK